MRLKREKSLFFKRLKYFLLLNFYAPLFGAGIRTVAIARDFSQIDVRLSLGFYNKNYIGSHFGGSLYAMCDPFYMLILIQRLGPEYFVLDKGARIEFLKPGLGRVRASFRVTDEQLDEIRTALTRTRRIDYTFIAEVKNRADEVVARVEKTLYIRKPGRDITALIINKAKKG